MRSWFHHLRDKRIIIALPIALLIIVSGAVALTQDIPFTAQDRTVTGMVVDAVTQQPLKDAVVKMGDSVFKTDENGRYSIEKAKSNATLVIEAAGYRQARIKVGAGGTLVADLQPLVVEGTLKDAESGKPVGGATVAIGEASTTTDDQGRYQLKGIKELGPLQLHAPGYTAVQMEYRGQERLDASLRPNSFAVRVVNDATNAPLSGKVSAGDQTVPTDANGQATLTRLAEGTVVKVEVPNIGSAEITYSGQPQAEVRLKESMLLGRIVDAVSGQPLAGAIVADGRSFTLTGQDGTYRLENAGASAQVRVRADGYDIASFDPRQERPAEIKLRPRNIRALYLTYYGIGDEDIFGHAMRVIRETEANALVIDVKGDRGWLAYKSNVPMVEAIGALQADYQIKDAKGLLDQLKKENIYTIARIVVFKDNPLARARPDLAVHDARSGGLWVDGEGLAWADPFREEVWDYNVALAVEAANLGFDEIQFDYVRFPTDPSAGTTVDATVFSRENLMANRIQAISGFLKRADDALKPTGAALAADIFGYVTWRTDDMGIGQHLETLGGLVDYICPMVYPTLYWDGIPRTDGGDPYVNDAPAHPYDIVHLSLKQAASRLQGARAKLRPWLQYYNDYILDIPYGAGEIELQKQATYNVNIDSWMMWDPSNRYAKGGFAPQ